MKINYFLIILLAASTAFCGKSSHKVTDKLTHPISKELVKKWDNLSRRITNVDILHPNAVRRISKIQRVLDILRKEHEQHMKKLDATAEDLQIQIMKIETCHDSQILLMERKNN
jgi:tRNA A37 N6-isopentenylltransferase MiaA